MPYRILLVEDDEDFVEEFTECFNQYNFLHTKTGEEAISVLKKPHMIDLVILDVKLPDMKGTEVLKVIKQTNPDLGIIILTGLNDKDVVVDALKGKADDYLEKPFDVDELHGAIQKILKSRNGKAAFSSSKDTDGKIELAKRFAESNHNKRISLKEVAEELCLSPKYFSRIFKDKTGQGFNEYKINVKMQEAKQCLKDSDLNINEVAQRVGYQDLKSFTRLFKKYIGCTPSAYRRDKLSKPRK